MDGQPAWSPDGAQLCRHCLESARMDVQALVRDYADLENVMADTGAGLEWVTGTREASIPIALGAEALQREIWYLTTTWEVIIRDHCGLSEVPEQRVRDGWAVQRAVRIIAVRVPQLAAIEAISVYLDGPDSESPVDMTGVQAILTMRRLHRRVGRAIGLRHLVHSMPGQCWKCEVDGGLRRDDGSETIYCALCGAVSPWELE